MNSLSPSASLKRSSRTRTRKNSISAGTDTAYAHPRTSLLARRKTRPPPLQIIPELSENELDIDTYSLATARPAQFSQQQLESQSSRITLSAYTFSIDDALLMLGDDAPRSPALSASSSTSDGASSEGIPPTPGASDDEDGHNFVLPRLRLRPQRISIRPLCITKTRSLVCKGDEATQGCFERDEEDAIVLPVAEDELERTTEVLVVTDVTEESGHDFYTREFEDFISISPVVPFHSSSPRRDSLTLVHESLPTDTMVPEPKSRGRSRHSKPLPLLPPITPPASSFPLIPTFPLVQTTAQNSIVRRKRNALPLPSYPPPPTPAGSRPLPRMSLPLDVEDCIFTEGSLDNVSHGPIVVGQVDDAEEDASVYSQPSFECMVPSSSHPPPPAMPESPLTGMYGEAVFPRSSTDSDAPRSSIDSTSSYVSPTSANTSVSQFSFPNSPFREGHGVESTQRLRSRWSSSTLASLAIEPPRTTTLLSPFKSVLNSRSHRAPPQKTPPRIPLHLTPSKLPKNKHGVPTPSPPSTPGKHIRQQASHSSTSSSGSSESNNRDGSPSSFRRKPIPMLMFLRAT